MTFPGAARAGIESPALDRLLRAREVEWESSQRVEILGVKGQNVAGATVTIRTLASRATSFMQLHVQTDAVGEGGATYSATAFLSSVQVDLRTNRQIDHSVARNGVKRYWVFLVPVFLEGTGTFTKFDGVTGADLMAFADLGV